MRSPALPLTAAHQALLDRQAARVAALQARTAAAIEARVESTPEQKVVERWWLALYLREAAKELRL